MCVDEKTGAIIATIDKEHDLFGKLAAVLNQKRAYSIRIGGPAQYIGFFEKKTKIVPPYLSVSKILKPDRR